MKVRFNDEIIKTAFSEKIMKDDKSTYNGFNTILKEAMENHPELTAQDQIPPINPLPEIQSNTLSLGETKAAGKVLSVQEKVIILKKDMKRVHLAKKDLPLFDEDTIFTREKGRIKLWFNDESTMTLFPESKLMLNRNIYDSETKSRSSSLDLLIGKARFWVKKLSHFNRSEFIVRTSVAVCGVRGSDFVVRATSKVTEITTFEDTKLEVLSLASPAAKPSILEGLERIVVEKGSLPSRIETITPEEVERMKKEFTVTPKAVESVG